MKNYEKLYNAALEKARQFSEHPLQEDSANIVEYIFPELVSEDERMKKAIMHVLYENYTDAAVIEGVEIAEIVAWLEKQANTKTLDADEVIEWLERNSSMFWESPCNPSKIVELFKKDFGLC